MNPCSQSCIICPATLRASTDFQCVLQGLDDEYQEEGKLLGQYTYQEDGEALQMFPVMVTEEAFRTLFELLILIAANVVWFLYFLSGAEW